MKRVLPLIFLLTFSPSAFAALGEFVPHNIGYPVARYEPVDVDGDGVWELAITTAEEPRQVGLYSHATDRWIDGPRELPVPASPWAAGDYDHDGSLEYVYRSDDNIMLHDPVDQANTRLWTLPDSLPVDVQFWGIDSTGRPLVALITPIRTSLWFITTYDVAIHDLLTGESRYTLYGVDRSCLYEAVTPLRDYPNEGDVGRMIVYQSVDIDLAPHVGSNHNVVRVNAAGPDWRSHESIRFISEYTYPSEPPDGYFAVNAVRAPGQGGTPSRLILRGLTMEYYLTPLLGSGGGPVQMAWLEWSNLWDGALPMFVFDIDANGYDDLVIQRRDNAGWERRSPYTLGLLAVDEGLPSKTMNVGPLGEAGVDNLFYLDDRTLFVWGNACLADTITTSDTTCCSHTRTTSDTLTIDWPKAQVVTDSVVTTDTTIVSETVFICDSSRTSDTSVVLSVVATRAVSSMTIDTAVIADTTFAVGTTITEQTTISSCDHPHVADTTSRIDTTTTRTALGVVPRNFTLHAYPNPFNSSVTLAWGRASGVVELSIVNILGQTVRTVSIPPAATSVEWDGRDGQGKSVPSGVYFARLQTATANALVKLVVLK